MMRRLLPLFLFLLILFPAGALASDLLGQIDALDDEKTIGNYQKSYEMCEKALQATPNDYDLNWRCARSHRWYGELAKRQSMEGWKEICADHGKKAMNFAQKAIELDPKKPNAYYWYGVSVGIYSDGVSIITALKEGLKNKTQESFEKVYQLDKNHEDAGSILALGRFWFVLPWPLSDKDLSLKYLREYQKTKFYGVHPEGPIYLAELLIDLGGDENEAEAKSILTKTLKTDNKYFLDWRGRLLKDLD